VRRRRHPDHDQQSKVEQATQKGNVTRACLICQYTSCLCPDALTHQKQDSYGGNGGEKR